MTRTLLLHVILSNLCYTLCGNFGTKRPFIMELRVRIFGSWLSTAYTGGLCAFLSGGSFWRIILVSYIVSLLENFALFDFLLFTIFR